MLAVMDLSVVWTLGLAGLAGLVCCVLGLRGRRVGNEPLCGQCSYNLTGLVSGRCPECGTLVTPEAVVHGAVRRRWLPLLGGSLLLAVCTWLLGALAYHQARMTDLHRYYPTSWLMADARRGEALDLYELLRREQRAELSTAQRDRLLETALQSAAQHPAPANLTTWLEALNRWDATDALSPDQRVRFYSQLSALVTPSLLVPCKVQSGGRLAFTLAHDRLRVYRIYRTGFAFTADDRPLGVPRNPRDDDLPGLIVPGNRYSYYVPEVNLAPGKYEVQYRAQYKFFRPETGAPTEDLSGAFLAVDVVSTAPLQVLPPPGTQPAQKPSRLSDRCYVY